ncbi:MAG: CHAT domain-containing protein [Kofleriaceae bacterium]
MRRRRGAPAQDRGAAEPLYVVAEGALAGVPFAALRVGGRYLIEARPVARVPGLAVLGCRPRAWTPARVFLGDAAGDLPRATEEVRRLGGAGALVGPAATQAALASSRDAALLHAAVHGRVTAAGGALELADGTVTAAEILEQQIAPREVVLTGCATAAARDAEAWGGFPSAFLAAGSQNVVATLRSVADADAATMAAAYDAAAPALGPVGRLAAAQRQLAPTHPASSWAFFSVWGDADCATAP